MFRKKIPWRCLLAPLLMLSVLGCGSKPVNRQRAGRQAPTGIRAATPSSPSPALDEAEVAHLNHAPDVPYVGGAACRECHAEIADAFDDHPMGQSMRLVTQETAEATLQLVEQSAFRADELHYQARWDGERMLHVEQKLGPDGQPLMEQSEAVAFEVGAGEHGRSFFVHRDGALWMSPMTLYPQQQQWGLSPNYEHENQHFSRPVTKDCLFCHANRAHAVAGTINTYQQPPFSGHAISCERCHGPGGLHVKAHQTDSPADQGGEDSTIVNPARLAEAVAADVCYQCHLSGEVRVARWNQSAEDYRPGQRLSDYIATFVGRQTPGSADTQGLKITGHVEQMHRSVCYQKSHADSYDGKRMGCTSCHDPHRKPAEADKARHFRDRCMTCHVSGACSEQPARRNATPQLADNCAHCHMPRTPSNVQHAAVTDHSIRRQPGDPLRPIRGPLPLAEFQPNSIAMEASIQSPRELSIALMQQAAQTPGKATQAGVSFALSNLRDWVHTKPADVEAADALAQALFGAGETRKALGVVMTSLDVAPNAEALLGNAAFVALQVGDLSLAKTLTERAARINAGQVRYPMMLGDIAITQQDWEAVERHAARLEAMSPTAIAPYQWRVLMHTTQGETQQAEAAFQRLLRLFPERREELEAWRSSL